MNPRGLRAESKEVRPTRSPRLAETPKPPYYAVIFASVRTDGDDGYGQMVTRMEELVAGHPGYLGHDSVRGADGLGITVAYFRDLELIHRWKQVAEHGEAQRMGRERWYQSYRIRICRVESGYGFERPR